MARDMARDTDLLLDLVEERAALIEEGCGVSRAEAERRAARMHGFADWKAVEAAGKGKQG
jgi:hypothetical protein